MKKTGVNKLKIANTFKSPRIDFDPDKGIFEISGVSLLENTLEYYKPILSWLTRYLENPAANSIIVFKLTYSNTSSLQFIYDIINLIYREHRKKTVLSVKWYYSEDDIDMKEIGEDYKESFDIDFSIIEESI